MTGYSYWYLDIPTELYTQYSFKATATADTSVLKLDYVTKYGGFFLDDISVEDLGPTISAVPEPSSIALVCTALPMGLGVAWKRRRKAVSAATA